MEEENENEKEEKEVVGSLGAKVRPSHGVEGVGHAPLHRRSADAVRGALRARRAWNDEGRACVRPRKPLSPPLNTFGIA